ncbi:MAG: hypothetical protein ACE5J5_07115 [Candidatus Hydrothermarchaeales archaeon]
MGILSSGNFDCLKELLRPAKKALKNDIETLLVEAVEDRVQLWNQIQENLDRYDNGECGDFSKDIDQDTISQFTMAQLKLAVTFHINNEEVAGVEKFTAKEIELVDLLEDFNSFDIKRKEDILKEIHNKDEGTLGYIKRYGREMEGGLERIINDTRIKLPVRLAFKKTFSERAEKLDAAVGECIRLFGAGWLEKEADVHIEKEVRKAAEEIEDKSKEMLSGKMDELEQASKGIEEKEDGLRIKEATIDAKDREVQERLDQIRAAMEGAGDNRFVTRSEAKMAELNYIGRFDEKMAKTSIKFFNPVENRWCSVRSWDEHEKGDEKDKIEVYHGVLSREEIENEMPSNKASKYSLMKKTLRIIKTSQKRVSVEARVWNHLDSFAKVGLDSKSMTTDELAGLLENAVDAAELGSYFHVIAVASPTGFSDSVISYVASEEFHRNFVSKHVSICLVDLETGGLYYNMLDDKLKPFIKIFEKEFDNEKVEKCKNFIKKRFETVDYVVLDDVVKEGFNREIVKKAFYELEKESFRVRYIEGVGLVVERGM